VPQIFHHWSLWHSVVADNCDFKNESMSGAQQCPRRP
jgi:hypothetical protein